MQVSNTLQASTTLNNSRLFNRCSVCIISASLLAW